MNKTPAVTTDPSDWLTPLLVQDAHRDPVPQQDATFVAQVLTRLDVQPADHIKLPMPKVYNFWTLERGLLLGFQLLVVALFVFSAPGALQAWLQLGQAPMNLTAWYDHNLWGFAIGLVMVIYGAFELLNMPEESVVI